MNRRWIWRRVPNMCVIDRGFGVVYFDYARLEAVTTWIGLNLIMRLVLVVYWWATNPVRHRPGDYHSLRRVAQLLDENAKLKAALDEALGIIARGARQLDQESQS